MKEEPSCLYKFEPFRLDPAKRILWRGSEIVPLAGRAFDTLLVLIQNSGKTVEKDQIIETVWRGAAVEENNLTQCISALRKALGESRGDNQFIVTFAGQGYRFVADVQTIAAAPIQIPNSKIQDGLTAVQGVGGEDLVPPVSVEVQPSAADLAIPDSAGMVQIDRPPGPSPPAFPIENPKSKISNRMVFVAISVFGMVAVLAAIFWYAERASRQPRSNASQNTGESVPGARRSMLAVLPFENLTGDPAQEYFSDGFTEEVITRLGSLDPAHVGVIARTSVMLYKHSGKNIRQIAAELGVEYVLEGSVRRSGDRVRVSVQLIKAADQTHLWAQSYEGPLRNILTLQENVATDVQERIGNRLDRPVAEPRPISRPIDPESFEAYLKGIYFLNRRDVADFKKAAGEFEKAIQKAPGYAPAYAGLADCYNLLGLDGGDWKVLGPAAQSAAQKGVALDGSLAETHTALAAVRVLYFWDWTGARREFRRALNANPNYALAHHWYAALYLGPQGHYPEAIAEMKLARQLDPVSPIVNTDLGWAYAISGSYDKAFAQYQEALRLSPRFVPAHFRLAEYYLVKKMYAQAIRELTLDETDAGNIQGSLHIEQEYKTSGFSNVLQSEIQIAKRHSAERAEDLLLARNYALLGRSDEAIQALSILYQRHDPSLIYLKVDPELASLRSSPKFQDLERRCGLIQ
jgi:TolB-like protein/DNA-binding winged helix-turn-helix (wHTH) protein/Tfp pilus assembly protein PilF